ncbi:MAG TPA: 4-hydroxy-tetrahydrodipicolinate synthase [Actinobacteria bacterium]|nr:4-hydroxy-tetrahydrodipicolinate synthase [Actinomycetota bacterium]HCK79418.1 4-hydroxy-tetrahydrodipicolinate synthase [Actinomycetota bacterium]
MPIASTPVNTAADPRSVAPFGRLLTAMVTPFGADGAVDLDAVQALAAYLVDQQGNDGIVVNGTTGEAPTTSDAEKSQIIAAVKAAVGDRAQVVAGVGTNDTAHTIELARQAQSAGADGLLVVTPYYNKPPQAGLVQHFTAVADATELPVVLYDIPARTSLAIADDTYKTLAEHPRIVASKDATADTERAAVLIRETGLAWYSGDDAVNLAFFAVGGVGTVSVTAHVVGARMKQLHEAFLAGDVAAASALHNQLMPVFVGIFRTQGAILTKAALDLLGLPGGGALRLPLVPATAAEREQLLQDLRDGGVTGLPA